MGKPCRSPSRLGAHMLSRVGQRTWCEVCSIVPWCVWLSCASHITFGPLGLCYPPFSSRWEIGLGCWGFPPSCHWQQIQNHKATAGPSKCHQSDVLVGRAEPEPEHDPICDRELAEITVTDTTAEGWWDENGLMVLQHLIIDSVRKMHRDRDLRRPAKARCRIKALLAPVSGISPASQSLEPCESARCNLMIDK
jgi:hypothetical protein